MTQSLRLKRLSTNQIFNLTRNTELGRGHEIRRGQWAVAERSIPEVYQKLEARLAIDGASSVVSRNHALIVQEGDDFFVYDLNSANGTYVNQEVVPPDRPRKLEEGDTLCLPNIIEGDPLWQRVLDRHPEQQFFPAEFKVSIASTQDHALLVGSGSDNEAGVSDRDVHRLGLLLQRRGYSVTTLTGEDATKAKLFEELGYLTDLAVAESSVLFSYQGHGSHSGLSIGGQVVSPKELYKRINRLRSDKIALMIESCHSGVFVNDYSLGKLRPDITVLTASSEAREAGETIAAPFSGDLVANSNPEYVGRMARALRTYLHRHRGAFDISEFYQEIMDPSNEDYVSLRSQNPQLVNGAYTVPRGMTIMHSIVPGALRDLE